MSAKKSFPIAVILSVTDGHLLCEMGAVYEILNFMTGDSLFTHQLPRAGKECTPHILRQHPALAEFDGSGITRENWRKHLTAAQEKFGLELEIEAIPMDDHARKDPVSELKEMVGDKPVIKIEGGDL